MKPIMTRDAIKPGYTDCYQSSALWVDWKRDTSTWVVLEMKSRAIGSVKFAVSRDTAELSLSVMVVVNSCS